MRRLYPSLFVALALIGCNDAGLTGSSGSRARDGQGKSPPTSKGADGGDAGDAGDGDDTDGGRSDGGRDGRGGADRRGGDDDEGTDGLGNGADDEGGEGTTAAEEEELCRTRGEGRVHIALVFDRSGSQSKASLASMRNAANGLVDKITAASAKEGAPTTRLVVTSFASNATAGANGWVASSDASFSAKTKDDIAKATANDSGDTYYGKGFTLVETLFGQVETDATKKRHRNLVVFLTDGEPDDGDAALPAIARLVNDKGVAVIAIGTGGEFADNDDGEQQILERHALPTTGKVAPDHKGQMLVAGDDAALQAVFETISKKLVVDPCKG